MIYMNGKEVLFAHFPNNESYLAINQLVLVDKNEVVWVYEDDSDFFKLAILKSYLDSMCMKASIFITYMPHSRMDRPNGYYAVSLNAAIDLINSLNFSSISVREPHSTVMLMGLKKIENIDNWCSDRISKVMGEYGYSSLYFPDYGAMNRYPAPSSTCFLAWGKKERDFKTGEIKGLAIHGPVGKNVLIVDDICSKGGTFIEAAKLLKEKGAVRIGLLVAYVEDNVFNGSIFDYIDAIYTSHDRKKFLAHPRIHFID